MSTGVKNLTQRRVWEIDALRGLLILCVLATHLYYTVDAFCINGYYSIDSYAYVNITDPLHFWFDWGEDGVIYKSFLTQELRDIWIHLGVDGFFVISGISCIFSRNNLKSGLRILCGAFFVSVFTKILAVMTDDATQFIRFGVLHCYALCHFIYYFLLENKCNKLLLIIAVVSLVVGYIFRSLNLHSEFALLVPFGIREKGVSMRDYWPIFPMLGWFLLGVVVGKNWYSDKKTQFPKLERKNWHKPLRFFGRHSGLIYCGHMVVYTLLFCGVGHIFNLY